MRRTTSTIAVVVAAALLATAAGCGEREERPSAGSTGGTAASTTTAPPTPSSSTTVPAPVRAPDPVLLAAGDIASCLSPGDEATAALVDARPEAVVATLGDHVYDRGRPDEFAECYEPSWGTSRGRTRPSPGNHDYATARAAGYFGYFGEAAGDPAKGYYSYDVGAWHVVALNSNCTAVPCAPGSAQEQWLRADLAASPSRCTLAYWHHPRFSSGRVHGSSDAVAGLWEALYDGGADLVLAGHEHHYERLGPLDPSGRLDEVRGLRSFVVGTGGRSHYSFGTPLPGSERRDDATDGVLQLTLAPDGFGWEFLPAAGGTFTDSGTAACH